MKVHVMLCLCLGTTAAAAHCSTGSIIDLVFDDPKAVTLVRCTVSTAVVMIDPSNPNVDSLLISSSSSTRWPWHI